MKIKVNFKSLMLLACFTALSSFAFAQRTISGMVTDGETNEPLVGAAIVVTGTTKGTLTDVDGKYTLSEIPAGTTTLTFSFTGYASSTIALGSSNVLDAKLKGGTILESVVVVGYGSVKQKESTSSVASLKAADFNAGNITSVGQLLQGKIAGLVVATPAGGNPNAQAQIRLRGISTFGANSSPLIIVDGVPNVPLNLVDPNDIESFDVLRDGSAAAIYGVQASSGVIIVTTKKYAAGKTSVNYSVQLTSENLATTPKMMTASQYLDANKAAGNSLADVDKGAVTDWYKEVTRSALSNVHNLTLSGGLGKGGYSASLNWRNQQGVAYDGSKQLNARINLNQKTLNDRLNLNFNFATTNQDQVFVQDEALAQASKYVPTAPVRFKDQTIANAAKYGGFYQNFGGFDQYNPKAIQDQLSNNSNKKRYTLSAKAELEVIKNLKWTSTYALTREDELNNQFVSRYSFYGSGADRSGIATRNAYDKNVNFFNSYLNYSKDLGQSNLSLTAGYEYQRTLEEGFGLQAAGFLTDDIGANSIGTASDFNKVGKVGGGSGKSGERLISFFGRANFNFNDIASVSAVVRRDGSSKFADGKQWGIFPAVSAALYLNKLLNLTSFDQLKLKVGYGVTGALPIQRYESKAGYVIGRDSSIVSQRNPSTNLTWEKKGELNVGIDFLALNSRLSGSFDFFNRNITDLLYRYNVPPGIFEYPTLLVNAGELNTKGFDFSIAYDILKSKDKGLNWKSSFVLSNFSTKLVSLTTADKLLSIGGRFSTANAGSPGQNSTPYSLVEEGSALGNFWGYQFVRADAKDGILIKNVKGESIKIADGTDADKVILGNGLPKFILGLTNTFNYGNFDFTFFLRGVFGHKIVNEYRVFYENANGGSLKSYNRVFTKYWDANIKDGAYNSYHVEKGDFLRLDNFTLGYNLPLSSTGTFNKVRVFLSGNNVATFTGYTGINPEVRFIDGNVDDGTGNPFAPGVERRSNYFTTRSFTIGANFGF
jgi:TonB-dependent starch-binding outer membrane protein SusC